VEAAFADTFPKAADPTSFLRLAGIPFTGRDGAGRTLNLLRVEFEKATDVGSVTPHLGGGSLAYTPLPAKMVSRRRRLAFVYQDQNGNTTNVPAQVAQIGVTLRTGADVRASAGGTVRDSITTLVSLRN